MIRPVLVAIRFSKDLPLFTEKNYIALDYFGNLLSWHPVAIETNKDSVIIFEEPEAHAFPYYTKFLAERISLDKTNQYFISTHNPYFLLSVLEKPQRTILEFITYFKDYQTKVKPLIEEEITKVLDFGTSVFFNLDLFLEQEWYIWNVMPMKP